MDEQQYKSTYQNINPHRCVFEKAINSRVCNCCKARRFNLADREGVACNSKNGLNRCTQLICLLREKARFALQRKEVDQVLGHAQEIKIQNGGLLGLQSQIQGADPEKVEDIDTLLTIAEDKFQIIDDFPYSQIMQIISTYKIRKRRDHSKSKKQK